jgi:hypothetical protein
MIWRSTITYRLTEDYEVDEDLPDVDGEVDEGAVKLLVDMANVQLALTTSWTRNSAS